MTSEECVVIVRDALGALWPGRFDGFPLEGRTSLGETGLGLDSIEVVELVLECEGRAGRARFATEEVLDAEPVTLARLIDHLTAA